MEILLALSMMAAMVVAITLVGRWVLGPIDAAARHRMRPVQFTMADFLSLIFLAQLTMAAIAAFVPNEEPAWWALSIFSWAACGVMWWTSVVKLSKAGIQSVWQRSVFLALILPLAYFGTIAWAILLMVLIIEAFRAAFWTSNDLPHAWMAIGLVALTTAFYAAGRFTRRMAGQTELPTDNITPVGP